MEEITIQDVREAILKVAKDKKTDALLENLNDEELVQSHVEQDLHMLSSQISGVIDQLSKDKHLHLPHELHKVLPNSIVKSIVDTVNLCIKEATHLGVNIEE